MAKVFIEETTLTNIGNAIRDKEGTTELIPVNDMATRITAIETGGNEPTDEELVVTGNCTHRFSYNGWNWVINRYGDRITTIDIDSATNMFSSSTTLTEIPFELNFNPDTDYTAISSAFQYCYELRNIPKFNNCKPDGTNNIFNACQSLREIPEDIDDGFDWSYIESLTSGWRGQRGYMFYDCYSLRSFPMNFLNHMNPMSGYADSIYYNTFSSCCSLDEIVNLPIPYHANNWTSNYFRSTFYSCCRLKNMTFALNPETNAPYVVNWSNQTIDLSQAVGHTNNAYYIYGYNSGITKDKKVVSNETYHQLKDDPDWFTDSYLWSRYNLDSAKATLNSLPDTSAYLATAGGTNTIIFESMSGHQTDAGGIIAEDMASEIAVATAKGWTVSLA